MSKLRVGMWGTTAFRPSIIWDFLKFLLGEGGSVLPWHVQSVSLPTGQPDDVAIQDIVVLSPPWVGNMGVHGAATDVSCAGGLSQWGVSMRVESEIHAACCRFDLDQFGLMCRDIADMAVHSTVRHEPLYRSPRIREIFPPSYAPIARFLLSTYRQRLR